MSRRLILSFICTALILFNTAYAGKSDLKIKYEKFTLKNGLKVILHDDRSDPITSVAVLYHVGSNREIKGRTGFAHLFEHMMFQESQHVGQDQFFKKIQGAGGTLNGGTGNDATIYYQVVPENSLEMVLWMESDRMGYLLSTVTQEAFANQQEVVQNEKRQRVDNQPYGHTSYINDKLLYPEDHPYNWQVIGSMEDLRNATLKDVHDFYRKWYGPNNATLVVAGSFDKSKTKEWIEKYFGELKPSPPVSLPKPMPVTLEKTKRAYYEDNFAKSPQLYMIFPTVEQYKDDAYALSLLGQLLGDGKKAPLYKVIVEDLKLAPSVSSYQSSMEIAGTFEIVIRSFPDKSLTDVENAIKQALDKFEKEGFTEKDLARIKAKTETNFYNGISSIIGKSFQLGIYNEYAGSPDYITTDLNKLLGVTKEDIFRVYNKYIKEKNYVLTSVVPKGKASQVAANSELFPLESEAPKTETAAPKGENVIVEKIPASFDRTVEPPAGTDPSLKLPSIWKSELKNGLKIYGVTQSEVPLVQFSITVKGGLLLDNPSKVGVANLVSSMMMEGTKKKSPIELEEAIDELGAYINMYTGNESIVLQANCLASNFDKVYKLAEEILLEPRWDEKEFARIKQETIEVLNRNKANPSIVASDVYRKLVYGNHILSNSTLGTEQSVNEITIDDLKNYYNNYFSPAVAFAAIAGDVKKEAVEKTFASLEGKWNAKKVELPEAAQSFKPEKSKIYFVDMPGARQSELRVGYLALPYNDPDYYPAYVMNYKLGGSFNGILNLILREEKGFTYGARSGFTGSLNPGAFTASTAVQSDATFESVKIIKDEITKYRENISDEDLGFTKSALIKSNALRLETLNAQLGMLENIAKYNLPEDYIKKEEQIVKELTKERHLEIAKKYLDPDRFIYLIVGDAKSQLEPLKQLGFGDPIVIDTASKIVN